MIPLVRDSAPQPADTPPPRPGARDPGDAARASTFDREVTGTATGPDRPRQQERPPQAPVRNTAAARQAETPGAALDSEISTQDQAPDESQEGPALPALPVALTGTIIDATGVAGAPASGGDTAATSTVPARETFAPGITVEKGGDGLTGGKAPGSDAPRADTAGREGRVPDQITPKAGPSGGTGAVIGAEAGGLRAPPDVRPGKAGDNSLGRVAPDQAAAVSDSRFPEGGSTPPAAAGGAAGAIATEVDQTLDPAPGTSRMEHRQARHRDQPPIPPDPAPRIPAQGPAGTPTPVAAPMALAGGQTANAPFSGGDTQVGAGPLQGPGGQDGMGMAQSAPAALSSAPAATATAMTAPPPATVSQQIVTALSQAAGGQVDLVLSPEELGRVRLSLSADDAAITVHVTAERPETLALIRRHIDILAQDFRAIGYESVAFGFSDQSGGQGRGAGLSGDADSALALDAIGGAAPRTDAAIPEITLTTGRTTGLDLRL